MTAGGSRLPKCLEAIGGKPIGGRPTGGFCTFVLAGALFLDLSPPRPLAFDRGEFYYDCLLSPPPLYEGDPFAELYY